MAVQFFVINQSYLFFPLFSRPFLVSLILHFSRSAPASTKFLFIIGSIKRKGFDFFLPHIRFIHGWQNPSLINSIFSQVDGTPLCIVKCARVANTPCNADAAACFFSPKKMKKSNGNSWGHWHCHQPASTSISINKKLCWTTRLSN